MKRSGFTMIELIFVIVILGILAAVAIPKLAATRDDAELAARATQSQTAINEVGAYVTARNAYDVNMTGMSVAAGAMNNAGQSFANASDITILDTRPSGSAGNACIAIVEHVVVWTGVSAADEVALQAVTNGAGAITLSSAGVIANDTAWTAGNFGNQNLTKVLVTVHSNNVLGGCDILQNKIPAGLTIVKGRSAQF